jgi:hypothetical protein
MTNGQAHHRPDRYASHEVRLPRMDGRGMKEGVGLIQLYQACQDFQRFLCKAAWAREKW